MKKIEEKLTKNKRRTLLYHTCCNLELQHGILTRVPFVENQLNPQYDNVQKEKW